MQHNEGLAPKSVGDLDINVWKLRYERNRNIVPAGLPRFFLGHVMALSAKVEELEFRLEQRTEALAKFKEQQESEGPAARKPATGSKKLKKED